MREDKKMKKKNDWRRKRRKKINGKNEKMIRKENAE